VILVGGDQLAHGQAARPEIAPGAFESRDGDSSPRGDISRVDADVMRSDVVAVDAASARGDAHMDLVGGKSAGEWDALHGCSRQAEQECAMGHAGGERECQLRVPGRLVSSTDTPVGSREASSAHPPDADSLSGSIADAEAVGNALGQRRRHPVKVRTAALPRRAPKPICVLSRTGMGWEGGVRWSGRRCGSAHRPPGPRIARGRGRTRPGSSPRGRRERACRPRSSRASARPAARCRWARARSA
jgi:hypothetical protein